MREEVSMGKEEIVTLKNSRGNTLLGILHHPIGANGVTNRVGVNLLNPGLKNRVAPNRLYIKIARALAKKGYYVLRMDPEGIGDSEGEIPEDLVVDIWGDIQQGRFVQDVLVMNHYFMKRCVLDHLVLMGSCGGAITALLVAEKDPSVDSLVLVDIPVILSSKKTISEDYLKIIEVDDGYRSSLTSYYFRSIFDPRRWLRVLGMKSDYRAIVKVIVMKWKELFKDNGPEGKIQKPRISNMNLHLIRAFNHVMAGEVRVLFLCAEKDADTKIFYKEFQQVYLKPGNLYQGKYAIHEIKEANHIYTLTKSQDRLINSISEWMLSLSFK